MLLCVDKTSNSELLGSDELDLLSDLIENLLFKDFLTEENKIPNLLALFTFEVPMYYSDEDEDDENTEEETYNLEVERPIFCRGEGRVDRQFESVIHEVWFEWCGKLVEELDNPETHSVVAVSGIADKEDEDTGLRLIQLISNYHENYLLIFAFTNEYNFQLTMEGLCGLYYALNIMLAPEESDRDAFIDHIGNVDKTTVLAIKRRVESWFSSERPSVVAWKKTRA